MSLKAKHYDNKKYNNSNNNNNNNNNNINKLYFTWKTKKCSKNT